MTVFNAGKLTSQNIGSSVSFSENGARWFGTLQRFSQRDSNVELYLSGESVPHFLGPATPVDVILPPAVYYVQQQTKTVAALLEEMQDLVDLTQEAQPIVVKMGDRRMNFEEFIAELEHAEVVES